MEKRLMREFFSGFIRIHILYHAAREDIYGQEFSEELKRHGYEISYGTLYPIFHRLEEQGFLTSRRENVSGKIRKYYSITEEGRSVLEEAKYKARELVDELFED